jgi:protein arginine kinase activator
MQCECCQEHEATIHLTQVANGQTREVHLCETCAEQGGLNLQGVMALPEVLFGLGGAPADGTGPDKSCPHCHFRRSDFRKTARLGCPRCYETFAEELAPMLAAMHKGTTHAGKVPSQARADIERAARLAALQQQLEAAVKAEQFEEAARVRDAIRELNG